MRRGSARCIARVAAAAAALTLTFRHLRAAMDLDCLLSASRGTRCPQNPPRWRMHLHGTAATPALPALATEGGDRHSRHACDRSIAIPRAAISITDAITAGVAGATGIAALAGSDHGAFDATKSAGSTRGCTFVHSLSFPTWPCAPSFFLALSRRNDESLALRLGR